MPELWSEIERRAEAPTTGGVMARIGGRRTVLRGAPLDAQLGRQPGLSLSWMVALAALLVMIIAAGGLVAGSWRLEDLRLPVVPNGRFLPTGSMSQDCYWCPASLLDDGRVLVVGSSLEGSTAQIYDPTSGTFSDLQPVDFDPNQGIAVPLEDGRVLFVGGLNDHAEIFDPDTGTFVPTVISHAQGRGPTGVAFPDGRVLLLGRLDGIAEFYDPATDVTTAAGSLSTCEGCAPAARTAHRQLARAIDEDAAHLSLTLLDDGTVLVIGRGIAGVYQPAAGTLSPTASMIIPRDAATATKLNDGRVLIVGGSSAADPASPALASAEIYDPAARAFTLTGSMELPRFWHASTLLADGRVLVTGGTDSPHSWAQAEIYDPASATFSPAGTMTQPRVALTAVALEDGRVLILGHYPGNGGVVPPEFPSNTAELFVP